MNNKFSTMLLTFNVKKEWFDKIKSGEKTHEYREVKPYWDKRFLNIAKKFTSYLPTYLTYTKYFNTFIGLPIVFKCGYPKSDDKNKILKAKIKSIKIINGIATDLKIDKPVYDIEFQLIEGGSCRI